MVKVTAENLPDCQVQLNIEVEPERVQKSFNASYRQMANSVSVPGFRRGKAPRVLMERYVGGDIVRRDSFDRLANEVFLEAVEQAGVSPIFRPEFSYDPDYETGSPMTISTTIEVEPKVELGDYEGIRLPPVAVGVTDEQVDESLERLRESYSKFEPLDREAKENDFVRFDLKGTVGQVTRLFGPQGESLVQTGEGRAVYDEKNHLHQLQKTERDEFAPGFYAELIGMKAGSSKRFQLSLPADHEDKELASKAIDFEVNLHEVGERTLPELDDEFATQFPSVESLEELREQIREGSQARMEAEARESYRNSLVDALIETSVVEVPPSMVERQVDRDVDSFKEALRSRGQSYDKYLSDSQRTDDDVRNDARERSTHTLKSSLALESLADAENLVVSEDEVDAEIKQQASRYPERLREYFEDRMNRGNGRSDISFRLKLEKGIDRLAEIATGLEPEPEAKIPDDD
jgi:trigger factor